MVGTARLVARNAATSETVSLTASSETSDPGRERTDSDGAAVTAAASSSASTGAATTRSSDMAGRLPVRPITVPVHRRAVASGRDEPELASRAGLEDAARLGERDTADLVQLGY